MNLEEILQLVQNLPDQELNQLAKAADWELQERAYRKAEQTETLGLIPLYRCADPEHQEYGYYTEDPDHPGSLVCGCPKAQAEFAGYE